MAPLEPGGYVSWESRVLQVVTRLEARVRQLEESERVLRLHAICIWVALFLSLFLR